jgi:hypothetical protein
VVLGFVVLLAACCAAHCSGTVCLQLASISFHSLLVLFACSCIMHKQQ